MECPKCHRIIDDKATVCPHCKKVLALICPNCKNASQTPVCEECGYIILGKCSKCGKTVSTASENCKCGFPVSKSIAYAECESDEFAAVAINFNGLGKIRRQLSGKGQYQKFYTRIQNILNATLKNFEGSIITYGSMQVLNFNKELSFPTSVSKAVKLALKIINNFSSVNANMVERFNLPLNLTLTIVKKDAEDLLKKIEIETNIKVLNIKKSNKNYLKGMQIVLDQYVQDKISKEYKTDSLYSSEKEGIATMYYEIVLDNYILPPVKKIEETPIELKQNNILRQRKNVEKHGDIYAFKVFDISAKCKFIKTTANELISKLDGNKLTAIRTEKDMTIRTADLVKHYQKQGKRVLHVVCTEELSYKPWGVFDQLLRDYYDLSIINGLIDPHVDMRPYISLQNLIFNKARKAGSPEDARFAYMEDIGKFLGSLKDCVVIFEGFENMDDTTVQTLSLYFDKFKKITADYVFITDKQKAIHQKIKGLLRTPLYTEYSIEPTELEDIMGSLEEDASNFISSFYYEKIEDNFGGSWLYFDNAIRFLKEKNILVNFENRLLIQSASSVLLPSDITGIIRARLKNLGKDQDASMIMAISAYLGSRLDLATLQAFGIQNIPEKVKLLEDMGFVYLKDKAIHINNYNLIKMALADSMKKEVEEFICKTILAKIGKGLDDTLTYLLFAKLQMQKEEYLVLWKNAQFSMEVGDYDAYLKNCLGFLSLIDVLGENIEKEVLEEHKKEVFQNILMSLYSYSPEKILNIENVLLMDAVNSNNNEQIVKLSNLMLQGALISSNYTDAISLLHNILVRIPTPVLIVNGEINTKFLLLSLVNIEILFNIGDFRQCIEVANDLLNVIRQDIIEKIKPAGFSTNFFVNHMLDTFRLASFAKLIVLDEDINEFFEKIKNAFGEDLPDKDIILSIREFLGGKDFIPTKTENSTPFTKIISLILQEFTEHFGDFKTFAQNIYQAKLLAAEIQQKQLELFCDLLIAYSYANIDIKQKADAIYRNILEESGKSAIFNILILTKYFYAKLKLTNSLTDDAMMLINDSLALIQNFDNQAKVFYALFEKLFIDAVEQTGMEYSNLEQEKQKLVLIAPNGELSRIAGHVEFIENNETSKPDTEAESETI